jgi:peptidoglycan/xylan/chitin deacetylase (PgdA/CDA1 family)
MPVLFAHKRRTLFLGLLGAMGLVAAVVVPPVQADPAPVTVSLTFNDGLASQYQYGAPVLKAHGMHGTFYVASNWVASGDANYLRSWQLDNLYRDGNEIGGMSKDHIDLTASYSTDPATDLAYKQDQVCGDKQALSDLGYNPVSFSYPFAASDSAAESIVQGCGYTSGRRVGGLSPDGPIYAESVPAKDPLSLSTLSEPPTPLTLDELESAVNAAAANGGGWLPIAFNKVCDSADPSYSSCMGGYQPIDDQVLSAFLDWLASAQAPAGTTVKTVREVMGGSAPPVLPPRPTTVSLTFDDALRSQYNVRTLLANHHENATFFIISSAVDNKEEGAMTWNQVTTLAQAGNEIGGHTVHHINLTGTDTSYDTKWHEVCDDRARLVAKGFNPVSFAYPEGAFDSAAEGIVAGCGYQSARTAGALSPDGPRYSEAFKPRDPYSFQALGTTYDGPITLDVLESAVNAAAGHGGGWVPMVFHEVCYPGTSTYTSCMAGYRPVDSTVLDSFMGWLQQQASNGVTVQTVGAVIGGGVTPPLVKVQSPAQGTTVTTRNVNVRGTAAASQPVTVSVYSGQYSLGTPVSQVTVTAGLTGSWQATLPTTLANGTYTLQASEVGNGSTGVSTPTTFTLQH